eukprot:2193301-Ditylum_brightwellii.AAC.1
MLADRDFHLIGEAIANYLERVKGKEDEGQVQVSGAPAGQQNQNSCAQQSKYQIIYQLKALDGKWTTKKLDWCKLVLMFALFYVKRNHNSTIFRSTENA